MERVEAFQPVPSWVPTSPMLEQLAHRPLISPRQTREHLRGETHQPGRHLRDLFRSHRPTTSNEGLNVVESWNRANSVIFFGKGGDIATNRRDEQELSVLCLRVLQAALVYVNTLMVQDVLADDDWAEQLTDADRRGLTPLFWTHVAPYGEVKLDMTSRLTLGG